MIFSAFLATSLKAVVLETHSSKLEAKFLDYIAKNGKSYKNVEEMEKRHLLWLNTDEFIRGYHPKGFVLAHNKFSDMTPEEKQTYLGKRTKQKET